MLCRNPRNSRPCSASCCHRYCQGAGSSPEAGVVAVAGTQVRRALQAAQRLSADCFLFWGGKDGYATPLNTDPARELRGYARLLRMTAGGFPAVLPTNTEYSQRGQWHRPTSGFLSVSQ